MLLVLAFLLTIPHVCIMIDRFCGACVSEWFDGPSASRECPVCKANVFSGHEHSAAVASLALGEPLRIANPLAFRILNHIRVKCPLSEQGCTWSGGYGEVNDHLTSSDAHIATSPSPASQPRPMSPTHASTSDGSTAAGAVAQAPAPSSSRASAEATALALKDQANSQFQSREFHIRV